MTVTIHLKPEIEAGLLARAQASGMALEEHLLFLAEEAALQATRSGPSTQSARDEAVRRMLEFGEKYHLTVGEPVTRGLMHEGHRY